MLGPAAADHDLALVAARLDVVEHPLLLDRRDDRADHGGLLGGSPTLRQPANAASPSTTWSKMLRWTTARVGAVQICPEWKAQVEPMAVTHALDVGVVEDHGRALAAQLHQQALHGRRAGGGDPLAHRGRSGEGDHVDVGEWSGPRPARGPRS